MPVTRAPTARPPVPARARFPAVKVEPVVLTGDMRGGNNAGIKTCFFNPSGVTDRRGAHIDYEIKSISEVPALLGIE